MALMSSPDRPLTRGTGDAPGMAPGWGAVTVIATAMLPPGGPTLGSVPSVRCPGDSEVDLGSSGLAALPLALWVRLGTGVHCHGGGAAALEWATQETTNSGYATR
jgi:hypothetical protein